MALTDYSYHACITDREGDAEIFSLAGGALAHNLARWTARIGLGELVVTSKTLRALRVHLLHRTGQRPGRLALGGNLERLKPPTAWPSRVRLNAPDDLALRGHLRPQHPPGIAVNDPESSAGHLISSLA